MEEAKVVPENDGKAVQYIHTSVAIAGGGPAGVMLGLLLARQKNGKPDSQADPYSPWNKTAAFRLNAPARETLCFVFDNQPLSVGVTHEADGFSFEIDGRAINVHGDLSDDGKFKATVDGRKRQGHFFAEDGRYTLFLDGEHYTSSQ